MLGGLRRGSLSGPFHKYVRVAVIVKRAAKIGGCAAYCRGPRLGATLAAAGRSRVRSAPLTLENPTSVPMTNIMNMKTYLARPLGLCTAAAALLAPAMRADYASAVLALNPITYHRLNATNAVPAELPALNRGTLGPDFNGEYQSMAGSRGLTGAIVGDADTAVSIVGSVGQQVVVPFAAAYNPNGPFTVEFWARPANADGGNHTVAISMVNGQNAANGDDRSGWCVRHVAGDWQVLLGYNHSDGSTFYGTTLTATGTVIPGEWQHVVAVYSGSAITLFVNGAQAATDTPGFPMLPNTGAPLILGDRGYTGWDYNGEVDEFAIYTSALSAADIQAHYQSGLNSARPKPYADLVLEKSPALYLRLGEPSLELPVAKNSGSLGAAADGLYLAGTTPGAPGLRLPAAAGFESTNVAAGFDGAHGSVQIPGLNLETDTFSMVCWIKRDGTQPARAGIMHNRKVTAPEVKATGLGFQDDGLALSYNWEDVGDSYNFNPGFVPPDQTWTFYAVTVAPTEAVMFMGTASGLVRATNVIAHLPHNFSGANLDLGWDNYQATRYFRGSLDEFATFDKTLTGDEVAALFNAALPAIFSLTRTPDPIYEGASVTFQTAVAGPAPVTYQWRKDGAPLSGKTQASLVLDNLLLTDSGSYDVVVTTGGQQLTSPANQLTVVSSPPIFTATPASAIRFINGTVRFVSTLRGSQPLTIQWKHGSDVIPGASSAELVLTDLQAGDAGEYTVIASNPYGTQEAKATLTLVSPSKYAAAVVDAGPVGYWLLDETEGGVTYDYWGGRDGTYNSGVTVNQAGPRPQSFKGFANTNTAYLLNGTGGKAVIPPLKLNKATATIVVWIKPDGAQVDYAGVVFSRGGAVSGIDYKGTTDAVGYHWNDAANTYSWESGLYPEHDAWNFVALVVEPEQATMYLDTGAGLQSAVNVVTHGPSAFDGTLQLGQDGTSGRLFKGTLDEVTVYDRALSEAEITKLRDAGFSGTYTTTPVAITQQPKSQTIMVGSSYTLEAKVTGSTPLTFQWKKNGQDVPGAIRSSLTFPSAAETDTGSYQLFVTQGASTISSVAATLTVKPVPAYINLSPDLVAHLKFDGNYTDSSGRNNHGTAQGSPEIVTGKIGSGAVHYSTVVEGEAVTAANYVSLGSPADLQFGGSTSFSIAFWTRFTGSPGDLPFLANNDSSYGGAGLVLAPSWQTGSWSWSLNDGTAPLAWPGAAAQYGNDVGYANALNDGNWHHLAFLVDRTGDATTYLDGKNVHAKSIAGLVFNLNTGLSLDIGQAQGNYSVAGDFQMDDLGIWRRVLTEYDAQAIYLVGQNYGRSFDTDAPPEIRIEIERTAGGATVKWTSGTLESAESVNGPWSSVAGATPPSFSVSTSSAATYYRVKQ